MKIISNRKARELVSFHDLPTTEQKDFDYVEGDDRHSYRFFKYKGNWYDSHEYMRNDTDTFPMYWDGYQSDSYFSGTLVRMVGHYGDDVIVGRYYC